MAQHEPGDDEAHFHVRVWFDDDSLPETILECRFDFCGPSEPICSLLPSKAQPLRRQRSFSERAQPLRRQRSYSTLNSSEGNVRTQPLRRQRSFSAVSSQLTARRWCTSTSAAIGSDQTRQRGFQLSCEVKLVARSNCWSSYLGIVHCLFFTISLKQR